LDLIYLIAAVLLRLKSLGILDEYPNLAGRAADWLIEVRPGRDVVIQPFR